MAKTKPTNPRKGKVKVTLWLHPEELAIVKSLSRHKHIPRDKVVDMIMWDVVKRKDLVE
jgi:hypothetical protein